MTRRRSKGATGRGLDGTNGSSHRSNVRANDTGGCGNECAVPCFKEELVAKLRAALPSASELEEARAMFAALADPTRLKILHALRSGEELCVCDVAHVLGMSVSAASHHLRKLRDLKILAYRTDGRMAYYSLRDRFVGDLASRALAQSVAA